MKNRKALLEAALFMSNEPLSLHELKKIIKADDESVKRLLEELRISCNNEERGLFLLATSQGFQLKVRPEFAEAVRHLTPYQDLGRGLLRVLALVAYKQPITQSEIVKVIGNRTYEYVRRLVERGLISTVKHGRTKALVATKEFAEYFGLEKPEDAKKFLEPYLKEEKQEDETKKE